MSVGHGVLGLEMSEKTRELYATVAAFMEEEVFPAEAECWAELEANTKVLAIRSLLTHYSLTRPGSDGRRWRPSKSAKKRLKRRDCGTSSCRRPRGAEGSPTLSTPQSVSLPDDRTLDLRHGACY